MVQKQKVCFIQLPFPSTQKPDVHLSKYYAYYSAKMREAIPQYYIPSSGLWELPAAWAFLSGNFRNYEQSFVNLSERSYEINQLLTAITYNCNQNDSLLFSPLAQNLDLTLDLIRRLSLLGYKRLVIGGNMTSVISDDKNYIVSRSPFGIDTNTARKTQTENIDYDALPDYTLLARHFPSPPLFRLFPNHGCTFGCLFCTETFLYGGIRKENETSIKKQVEQMQTLFPDTSVWYNSDKTFGQDKEGMQHLISAFGDSVSRYQGIVQTRAEFLLNPSVIEGLKALGVVVVEIGFETANMDIRRRIKKPQSLEVINQAIEVLERNGIKAVLNVLVGLPWETGDTYQETLDYLLGCNAWLFNIYNFVPYPRTPLYSILKQEKRIVDNNWSYWREDAPLVYKPYYLSRKKHWFWFQEFVAELTTKVMVDYSFNSNNPSSPVPKPHVSL